jgi:hypothetical protein
MGLLGLSWPEDVLYVVLLAFHRFLIRAKARWQWEFPERKGRSKSKSEKRKGGFAGPVQQTKMNAFQTSLMNTARIHCFAPDNRLSIKI